MFGQANNQLHNADHVGTDCVDSTTICEASFAYALKFCRCHSVATEILLDGNSAIAAFQSSSVTEAGNLYLSLNDSFQTLMTIPYVRLNEANKQKLVSVWEQYVNCYVVALAFMFII